MCHNWYDNWFDLATIRCIRCMYRPTYYVVCHNYIQYKICQCKKGSNFLKKWSERAITRVAQNIPLLNK